MKRHLPAVLALAILAAAAHGSTVSVDKDMNLVVDGRPFFVMAVCDVYPASELAKAAELGFNTVEVPYGPADLAYLDEAHRLGLKVIPWFGGYDEKYLERSLQYINRFKDHPAILGWFTIDEPANFGTSVEALAEVYRAFKTAAPDKIVFNNFNAMPADAKYKDTVDVFAMDPYPIVLHGKPGGNVASVATETRLSIEAIGASRPLWFFPQAFGELASWKRAPDGEEYRALCFLPVLHGARGYLAYTYRISEGVALKDVPALQDSARVTNREMTRMAPALLRGGRKTLVRGAVHAATFDVEEVTWLVVANASHMPVQPSFPLASAEVSDMHSVLDDRRQPMTDEVLRVELGAYDVRAFRITWRRSKPEGLLERIGGECGPIERNLALTGKVSTSSTLSDRATGIPAYEYFMDRANDGRPNTFWGSEDPYELPQWVQVTLSEPQLVNRVVISTPSPTFYDNWKEIRLEFSDGSVLSTTRDDTPLAQTIAFDPRKVEWVRAVILSTYSRTHYVGCAEFEIYGPENDGDANAP